MRETMELRTLYHNPSLREKHKNFLELLQAEKVPNAKKRAMEVRASIEQSIKQTVDLIAALQYYTMEKTGNWGDYGQERVIRGYTRLKLNIPPEHELYDRDIQEFQQLIDANEELKNLSVEQLKEKEDSLTYNILEQKIKIKRADLINRELRFCDSKNRISVGMFGKYRSVIYGQANSLKKEQYEIYLFEKELSRTPANIMSIAGVIGEKDVGLRKESCRFIFEMKWKQMFFYNESEKSLMYKNEASNIREMLKVRAIEAYEVSSLAELEAKKELFIEEMIEGILWHELGHGVFFNEELDLETTSISKALNYFGENIIGSINEVLADWAIKSKKLKGAIKHFLEIAILQNEQAKARRMLLVYMSDNWFLDSQEEFLGSQTDLIVSILCPFLTPDYNFNFEKMNREFDNIHKFMLDESLKIIQEVINIAKTAVYQTTHGQHNFEFIEKNVDVFISSDINDSEKGTLAYLTAFWFNVFLLMEKLSPESFQKTKFLLEQGENNIKLKLLELIAPQEAQKYGSSIRDYLFDQMKAKGFYDPHLLG